MFSSRVLSPRSRRGKERGLVLFRTFTLFIASESRPSSRISLHRVGRSCRSGTAASSSPPCRKVAEHVAGDSVLASGGLARRRSGRARTSADRGAAMIERSPLWPPWPPPTLTRSVPKGRSISSWTTTDLRGLDLVERRGPLHRRAREVHELLRLEQHDLSRDRAGRDLAAELRAGSLRRASGGRARRRP